MSRPRVTLVQVAREGPDGEVWRPSRLWFHGSTLPYLAALFSPRCDVRLVDELIEDVPFDDPADLVGLTFMGASLPRAMRIADRFRAAGRTVVAGGATATAHAGLVAPHVDALVLGDAEGVVDRLLDDFQAGRLQRTYCSPRRQLDDAPLPRYDLLDRSRLGPYYPVEATRGCSIGCGFCLTSHLHGRIQRRKPVALVARDLRHLKGLGIDRVLFVDDNAMLDRRYFEELLDALEPMGLRWTANATMATACDEALLDRMARAGCESLSIGFETLQQGPLDAAGKGRFRTSEYARAIAALRSRGIQTVALFVLGLDGDGPETFRRTEEFLLANRVELALFHILTPVQGTPLHAELQRAGRLLDVDLALHGADRAVFAPSSMTVRELEEGFWQLQRRFYSPASVLRRLVFVRPDRHYLRRLPAVLANLYLGHLARGRRILI